jgi:hypothetical protein
MGRPASLPTGNRLGRADRRSFRFPCGHVEGGDSVERRTHITERAVWVRCHACNVIGLLVASPSHREPARTATQQRP